jgi:hypothetical protein
LENQAAMIGSGPCPGWDLGGIGLWESDEIGPWESDEIGPWESGEVALWAFDGSLPKSGPVINLVRGTFTLGR